MENVLILGNAGSLGELIQRKLSLNSGYRTFLFNGSKDQRRSYLNFLSDTNVIVSLLGPMDVDLAFEALFAAIHRIQPPLKQFIMLSSAGINHEVKGSLNHPGINNLKEYIDEQQYAIKIVDEEELPYTILRPVNLTNRKFSHRPMIINEGHPVPAGVVSYQTLADLVDQIIDNQSYLNRSIAVVDKKEPNYD